MFNPLPKTPRCHFVASVIIVVLQLAAGLQAQAPAEHQAPFRALVKLRSSLASDVEASIPAAKMEVAAGKSGNGHVEAFLARHAAKSLKPLYPDLVRLKKARAISDFEIASEIRNRFPKRSAKLHGTFNPPDLSRTFVIELNAASADELERAVGRLSADPEVEYAETDKVVSVNDIIPNDPYFSTHGTWGQAYDDLWGIKVIGAPAAWSTNTGQGVVVAVVDTGIDLTHPDIVNNLWTNPREIAGNGIDDDGNGFIDDVNGWDFIGAHYYSPTQDNNVTDGMGHGTHVAGTIAATGNNGIGVVGVAWGARVMPVKGLDNQGYGLDSTLANAIRYAANNGAEVISNSWGGPGSSQTIADAINYAYSMGAVIVAAAGNNGDDARKYYPANLPNVITVGASTPPSYGFEYRAYFSNWGSKIDVLAPGQDILSLRAAGTTMGTTVDAYYTRADGTSMATPHVSGAAALILSQHPEYSNEDVRQALRTSATDISPAGFDLDAGYGRISASSALSLPSVLEARITAPTDGTHIKSLTAISGIAGGNRFSYYTLEYGAGELPASWTLFQTGNAATSGTLGSFDPSSLPDGIYTIRLTAYDVTGRGFVDRMEVNVDYVTITSPAPPSVQNVASEYKTGAQIPIVGTASGVSFRDFHVEWAEGINPSSGWSSTGISLTGGGTSPVTNDVVATWDTSSIAQADYYTLRLTVDDAGFSSQAYTLVYLEPDLLALNWPKWLPQGPSFGSGLLPARDGAGNMRLTLMNPIYSDTNLPAQYWSIAPDGSTLFTQNLYYGDYVQPAVGEMDGLPGDESVVPEADKIRVFHSDNSSTIYTANLPVYINFQYALPILEDLNGDSQQEIVTIGRAYSTHTAYIFAWRRDGQQFNANFPIALADQNYNVSSATGPRVLVGDIDGDGKRELIAQEGTSSNTFTLRLFSNDGTPRNWMVPLLNGYPDKMLLADLDHNGQLETILLMLNSSSQKVLHVFQPDGTERAGWPVVLGNMSLSQMAVADLNRDGREEILVVNNSDIYAFNSDGTSFSSVFPIPATGMEAVSGLAVADIDGDGYPEILTIKDHYGNSPNPLLPLQLGQTVMSETNMAEDGSVASRMRVSVPNAAAYPSISWFEPTLEAIRRDGTIIKSWRLLGANGNQPFYQGTITVGDFNGDGLTDIGVAYQTVTGGGISGYLDEGVATVLTTHAPFNAANNDWPMIYGNARNTAVLIRDHIAPVVSVTSPATGASVFGQVTLAASASDNVGVTGLQFQVDGVSTGPVLTIAPFSFVWDSTQTTSGTHTITAVATDAAGNSATSAPVNVTVQQFAKLVFSPSPLAFAAQQVGAASAAQSVTLTNEDQAPATIAAISISGDYAETDNCVTTLAPGASCVINVVFTPGVRGPDNGALKVSGTFSGIPPVLTLTGSGLLLQGTASPNPLTFSGMPLNSRSMAPVTYSNTGDLPVTITGISVTGDFSQTNTCGSSLAPGANCVVTVSFIPTAVGTRTGVLSINGNVNTTVNLSGIGQVGKITISPSSLSFGNQNVNTTSATQVITVTSVGTTVATITSWSWPGPFSVSGNCFTVLQPGSSCTFNVTFTPTAAQTYSGTLSFNGAFENTPANVPLTGTGVAPGAGFSLGALNFSSQRVGTSSAAQSLVLTSTGGAPLSISGFTMAGDFSQSNNCPASLAPGTNCTVNVVFSPTARGTRSGTLTLNSNALLAPAPVSLSGIGLAPVAAVSPASLTFAPQRVNTTSGAQSVTLTNSGDATLNIASIVASGEFAQTNNCTTTLAAGARCTISVTSTPLASGLRSGAITISDDASGSPQTVALNATGIDYSLAASPSSASVTSGANASYTVTVSAIAGSFNASVALKCSGLPAQSSCSFSPASVTPNGASVNSVMKVSTHANRTPPGSYTITITGTSGSTVRSAAVGLTVQ